MDIDEAIADCVRQVPECAPIDDGTTIVESCGMDYAGTVMKGQGYRALWFHAAWKWLCQHNASVFWPEAVRVSQNADGKWDVHKQALRGTFKNEFLAMRTAILIAKGLKL